MAAHSACSNCSGPNSDLVGRLLFPAKVSSRITFSPNISCSSWRVSSAACDRIWPLQDRNKLITCWASIGQNLSSMASSGVRFRFSLARASLTHWDGGNPPNLSWSPTWMDCCAPLFPKWHPSKMSAFHAHFAIKWHTNTGTRRAAGFFKKSLMSWDGFPKWASSSSRVFPLHMIICSKSNFSGSHKSAWNLWGEWDKMGFGKARTLLTYNDKVEGDDDFSSASNKPLRKYSSSAVQSVKIPCASFQGDTETRHRIWEIPENSLLAPHLSPLQPVKRLRSRWSSKTCCKPCLRARATTQGS